MPKKKIAADTPEEAAVMPETEETSDLVELLQEEHPVEGKSVGTGDKHSVQEGQETDAAVQDAAQGSRSRSFPEKKAPDEASLTSESEPAKTSKASEAAPEVEDAPASDDPYGIDYPAPAAEVMESDPAEGVPAPDADLSDTGSKDAATESAGPTEEDSKEALEAAESAKGSEDRTP